VRSSGEPYIPALRFRWLTAVYDPVVALTTRERTFKHRLLSQAQIEPGMRVLDLGCGTGTLAVWLKQRTPAAEVVGLDADPAVLALARRKATRPTSCPSRSAARRRRRCGSCARGASCTSRTGDGPTGR
jgi:SAM-dependent methyltransferase